MSKPLAILAGLKTTVIEVSIGFAHGDMLPFIVISGLFSIVQLGAKLIGQSRAIPRTAGGASISSKNEKVLQRKAGLSPEAKGLLGEH